MSTSDREPPIWHSKSVQLVVVCLVEFLVMGLWFAASAVIPQLQERWQLSLWQQALLTVNVQLGFVLGGLISALANLADRVKVPYLIGWCGLAAAGANLLPVFFVNNLSVLILSRFVAGMFLAGVYPPGMKFIASWCNQDRGFGIGVLIAALTAGSALPHLFNALGTGGMPAWITILQVAGAVAGVGSLLSFLLLRSGPLVPAGGRFFPGYVVTVFRDFRLRRANLAYFGHMWELYAMWCWLPLFLFDQLAATGMHPGNARLAGFAAVFSGAAGCVAAGIWGDRWHKVPVTMLMLATSMTCSLFIGFLPSVPELLIGVSLLWGVTVVADSGQFSALISEYSDPDFVGTALTLQTALGFLITPLTILLVPWLRELLGWGPAFAVLAVGPMVGLGQLWRLRREN